MRNLTKALIKWPWIWLSFVWLAAGAFFALFVYSRSHSWIPVAVIALGTLLFTLCWHLVIRNKIQQTVTQLATEIDEELSLRLSALQLPYAVVNRKGKLLWHNEAFQEMLNDYGTELQKKAVFIQEIFPQINYTDERAFFSGQRGAKQFVPLGDRVFSLLQRQTMRKNNLTAILLCDETEHVRTMETLQKERGAAGLIYVDNYEELLKQTESGQHSLLGAMIEQQIQKYFQDRGGIVCKTEKDRFSIFINHEGLDKCRADRFSLLDAVRGIRTSGSMQVTLSIAFGEGAAVYQDNLGLAQVAMDLALGRGGDQAVIKRPEGVEYFGGKAQGETAQTRVRARVKAQALRELMALHNPVYIMGHANGDNDSFGASVAIYRAAVSLSRQAHIVLDTVSFSVRPFWERFQASADYPRHMFLTGEEALARFEENAMLVVVDTNQQSMVECPGILEKTDQIVVFDHHRQAEGAIPALLSYVEPYASSSCEMVTEILQYFNDGIVPKPLEAEAIYSGILIDTDNFGSRTSSRTFEAAAYLKRSGADLVQVKKMLREDYREYMAKARAMQTTEMTDDGFAFAVCEAEGLESPTIIGAQVANDLLNISGVKAGFVFTRINDLVYVSARAIDEVNVQLIMERLGGGGHLGSAGAQLKDMSETEAVALVRGTIRKMQEEGAL
ncbi:MAG: DHH family phosphoesterase [Lachnospiraceae bacterium]|nr:DHH family phosphoesterase [Lachnospiraceae bacterium]